MPGDRLAALRQSARLFRASCGRIPARSCCSWAASSRRSASGTTISGSTGSCSAIRCMHGVQRAGARPQPALPRDAGAASARLRARRVPVDRAPMTAESVVSYLRRGATIRTSSPSSSAISRPVPRDGLPDRRARGRPLSRAHQHRRRATTAAAASAMPARSHAEPHPMHGHPHSLRLRLPPLGGADLHRRLTAKDIACL